MPQGNEPLTQAEMLAMLTPEFRAIVEARPQREPVDLLKLVPFAEEVSQKLRFRWNTFQRTRTEHSQANAAFYLDYQMLRTIIKELEEWGADKLVAEYREQVEQYYDDVHIYSLGGTSITEILARHGRR